MDTRNTRVRHKYDVGMPTILTFTYTKEIELVQTNLKKLVISPVDSVMTTTF